MTQALAPAAEKITDDNAAIEAALTDASIPTLMLSMIHMSGDAALLDGGIRPLGVYLNEVQGYMSEEDKAGIRAQALDVITRYRDNGCQAVPIKDPETIRRMMSFLVAEEVPMDYVPMMLEEMELDGDARQLDWGDIPADKRADFHVTVIGGGMSGVLAAIRLKEAGINFTVIEKNAGVGGTWYENRYPGCRVDVGNHFYCYSFAPNHDWSEYFARQPELQQYFEDCLDRFGVREHFRFNTEVVKAQFDESLQQWQITLRAQDGSESELDSNAMISAVGQLNRPKLPDIEGRESFAGVSMHSAQWRSDVDVRGKRVAVIGTGASAFQLVPTIADEVESLAVYQRSAPWMFPNIDYHREVEEGTKWCMKHLPFYSRWYRFLLFWPACDGLLPSLKIDPNWPHQDRSINEMNEMVREVFTDWMKQQVGDDEALLAKVVPDYVPLAKRTLQDNGSWLSALKKDNVELNNLGIREITEQGVIDSNGELFEADIIVFATGFHANKFLWPMEIVGRKGIKLNEQWGEDPAAYLGITVPNFPNLFCLYGPGTNLAFGGSLIFHSECEVRYSLSAIKTLLQKGNKAMEVRQTVHDDFQQRLQNELSDMVWSHPSVKNSWYQNDSGKVTVLSPWRLRDFWEWTQAVNAADYNFV
ncbi:MAG TPA: 4-hydroxyacetophenone monooxygenase [Spongiibacteraceae bacterium]|nr:4-hydroxyacetophenone monooxygenase [Spongiibacteraceae bacterium]HCS29680.1 4-hydroxyacetophenone monooxygenase [Spongiibacteraceae bacterium]|tara:strand:- start:803 stop:2737 length:1935 start_codon:yes stop_codon:yes gene_type:complete